MVFRSALRPFWVVAIALFTSVATTSLAASAARAENAQQAALFDTVKADNLKADTVKLSTPAVQQSAQSGPVPADSPQPAANQVSPANQSQQDNPAQAKGVTDKAIDKVKQVAKSARDIFSRVPCLPPKGAPRTVGSLPHIAHKLVAGEPVVIIAFGSSSTQGYGSSSPEFTYPNRLADQLKRKYPTANITITNRGRGGEDAPEMMKRLQTEVIDAHPDMVIWQVGTNAVLRDLDPDRVGEMVQDGVARIQSGGADVVLVDPQYSPQVTEHQDNASKMVRLLSKVAQLRHIAVFPRFEVMRQWHENQALPIDTFVIADGLHMNDWGYACFAQTLGDDIIRSVGQIKIGVNVQSRAQSAQNRPM
jgi:lysophospholipase L1-like esterase